MARPRVFVSSTYYDLKHLRSSLDGFIESLGFDSVLSEKGDIAFSPDKSLEESCYREARGADILVLIIGGRYGTEAADRKQAPTKAFFDKYDSITKREYEEAAKRDVPIFVLIEKGVYTEYMTFQRNKGNLDIKYAHVDSVNVFELIETIVSKPRNNPIHQFEKFSEIEKWLREQWAGLFRELLNDKVGRQELSAMTSHIGELKEVNETLKKYLEAMMTRAELPVAQQLIRSEDKRLEAVRTLESLRANHFVRWIRTHGPIDVEHVQEALLRAKSQDEFVDLVAKRFENKGFGEEVRETLKKFDDARNDLSDAREILGLQRFDDNPSRRRRGTRGVGLRRKKGSEKD